MNMGEQRTLVYSSIVSIVDSGTEYFFSADFEFRKTCLISSVDFPFVSGTKNMTKRVPVK